MEWVFALLLLAGAGGLALWRWPRRAVDDQLADAARAKMAAAWDAYVSARDNGGDVDAAYKAYCAAHVECRREEENARARRGY